MAPKLGKMDIDYRVLHDAFFKYQTKPKLTIHGDLYYEGKEFEITLKEKRPGHTSDDLKRALGMPEGAPPPWLINMQRYGPPPSYPNLKIPGLNAPIPEGARYGYHPGGWGKPPVDEFGRPLYGDVFGTAPPEPPPEVSQPIEKKHWGEMEVEEEEEEEEEEEAEQEKEGEQEESTNATDETDFAGNETPVGFVPGTDAPSLSSSSKKPPPPPPVGGVPPPPPSEEDSSKPLYQVLEQKETSVGSALYGSTHKYVIPSGDKKDPKSKDKVDIIRSQATEKLELALNPSEVENIEDLEGVLKKKYEAALSEKHQDQRVDVSDVIAEYNNKKKRKKDQSEKDGKKKHKDFKF